MTFKKLIFAFALLLLPFITNSQDKSNKKITISGKIVDKKSNQPLEFSTVTFVNFQNPKSVFGGMTNAKGEFDVVLNSGTYDVKVDFMGFKPMLIKQQTYSSNTNLGNLLMSETANELNEVIIRSEKSTVDIKLDKKVFNVGKDMIVKGGNASDVLQNVPSVNVDSDGNVSMRGNENVTILIDGRPVNSSNLANTLKTIPADALDKVEIISNPSARYDAEGGAGILNIVLKKGKTNGFNATITATVGDPKNILLNGTVNYKSEKFNLFSGFGFADSNMPGFIMTNTDYFDNNRNYKYSINEYIDVQRARNGNNFNFGVDWFLTKKLTWTNSILSRKSDGNVPQISNLTNNDPANTFRQTRINDQFTSENNVEYSTNFTQKFKKEGQKLTVDGSFSRNLDNDKSGITENIYGTTNSSSIQKSNNRQIQYRNTLQTDFVLPLKNDCQIEMGYRGNFLNLTNDFAVGNIDSFGNYVPVPNFTNVFQYKEKVNAFYLQFGSKFKKLSYLLGLRYENSDIDINYLSANEFRNKQYANFFPSAFLAYQITDKTSFSVNYSKRIARPRDRFIVPFSNYTSNVNIFQGNPDIDPAFTDAFELGYLTKWDKLTLTAATYYNKTSDPFQFTRRDSGLLVGTVPVLISSPVNLDKEERYGLELNANFTAFKWWKINGNVNIFNSQISGSYSFNLANSSTVVTETINRSAGSWFAKLNSNITLPYKINFQSNAVYTAEQNTAQGKSLATLVANMAFSKDVLNDKATITLGVTDLFNQQKMMRFFNTPTFDSYSERQGRMRQVNLSFTYRFNKQKTDKDRPVKREDSGGGDF